MSAHAMLGLTMLASCAWAMQGSEPARNGQAGQKRAPVSASPTQRTSDWILRSLCECYNLTPDQKNWLQAELKRRADLAEPYEQESQQLLLQRAKTVSSSDLQSLASERTRNKPLMLENVRKSLEPRLSAEQRRRGDPLIAARQDASARGTKRAVEERTGRRHDPSGREKPLVPGKPAGGKVALAGKSAPVSDPGKASAEQPVVAEDPKSARRNSKAKPQHARKEGPSKTGAHEADTKSRSSDSGRKASAKLSDWQKTLADYATRYRFTEAQMGGAQAILKDCERRYEDYRKAHAADYQRVEKIADSKQRAAELATLDAPLAALGHEFTQRLEQIPTADQRAAATSAKPSKSR